MDPTPMRILVVGHGGRETAICRALSTAATVPELLIAPGNAGTAAFGQNVAVDAADREAVVSLAMREGVDLVLPGPKLPLVRGLADRLAESHIPCAGPSGAAAALEGSTIFAHTFMREAGLKMPNFAVTRRLAELAWAIDAWDGIPILKADGLAGRRGVFLPASKAECLAVGERLLNGDFGEAGREFVVEQRVCGVEATLTFACDATIAAALPHALTYKRLDDGETGASTGGMGAVSPNPHVDATLCASVAHDFIDPVLALLARRGTPYRGFLGARLMLTSEGPRLLALNVRLGDPEAQAILPRLPQGSFLDVCAAIAQGSLASLPALPAKSESTCALVLAAAGYPGEPSLGGEITIDADLEEGEFWVDWGGARFADGHLYTSAGRVGTIVGSGQSLAQARAVAYDAAPHVTFAGRHLRSDIGASS